jgi:hypothetical protein
MDELEEDLGPFRSEASRWDFQHRDAAVSVVGFLAAARFSPTRELYLVRDVRDESHEFAFSGRTERVLTIWRVAERLDMLQLRLRLGSDSLSAQVGGAASLPILATLAAASSTTPPVRNVLELYRSGQAPENGTD